jgi:hypothetical protein
MRASRAERWARLRRSLWQPPRAHGEQPRERVVGPRGAAFAVAAGVLFAVLAVLWLLAARGDQPQYRRTSGLFVTGTAACAIGLAATALIPWGLAVARRLASGADSPGIPGLEVPVGDLDFAHHR